MENDRVPAERDIADTNRVAACPPAIGSGKYPGMGTYSVPRDVGGLLS